MDVTLMLGPAGAGKTHRCLERIRALRSEGSGPPLWVLVPDRLQAVAFRSRLARAGGALGVQVGTFEDLYRDVLIRAGHPVPQAPDSVVQLLLRESIDDLLERGEIKHYAPIAATSGFVTRMAEAIAELKRALCTADQLAASDGSAAIQELAALYADYESRLAGLDWTDRAELAQQAAARLQDEARLWSHPASLIVDGFDSLEATQLRVLQQLAARLPEITITLPGDRDMTRPAFRRFARALARLRRTFPEADEEVLLTPESSVQPELGRMERGLFEAEPASPATVDSIELLEVRNPAQEAREALRWLKARIRRDGLHPDRCALVVPDPERYRALLQQAAGEFGLRLRSNFGQRLPRAPAVAALFDLLQLHLEDYPRRALLDTVRSPYFDLTPWALEQPDALALDAASHYGQVVGGLDVWLETLRRLAEADRELGDEREPGAGQAHLPQGGRADQLLSALSHFAERLSLPPEKQALAQWVRWVEDLLDDLSFPERQQTEDDEAAFGRLRDTLRALLLGQSLGWARPHSYAGFLDQWRTTLEGVSFRRRLDPQQPAVTVLRLLEARGLRYQAVAVLGLSEGLVPEVEREDPFLPEDVRRARGLEPRLEREQGGLFYQAVTRANQRLLLTRPYLADDGQSWEPSPYWRAVERLVAGKPQRLGGDAPQPLLDAASSHELLFWGVRRGSLPQSLHEEHAERWRDLQVSARIVADRLADQAAGPYEGFLEADDDQRAGQWHRGGFSPSRLETYGTCPHFYWVSNLLGVESREPPELGFDAAQLGSILHAILERSYLEADDPADVESVLQALEPVSEQVFAAAPQQYGFRPTPLWELEQRQLLESLRETVRELDALEPGWKPLQFEATFGRAGQPALEIDLAGGESIRVGGVIDRVDRNAAGELRIIDYKTGSSHLSPSDLVDGRRLQLPLYAAAAERALELGEPVEGLYWSILRAGPSSLRLSRFSHEQQGRRFEGLTGAYQMVLAHIDRAVSAIGAGRFPPQPPRGGCPSYCPAAAWCWRYEPAEYG